METKKYVNNSEEFVYNICRESFLSLWSYANPQGKDNTKELCDILVVCEPDIIIFSVKDINVTDSGDEVISWKRWRKKAVEESAKQIYGAERFLKTASHVTRKDGTSGLPLSKDVDWLFHRVAVALGSMGKVPFEFGDFGKGFVNVFDETSFSIILQELDTITDFVNYLIAKEELYASGAATLFEGAEEDLLGLYLHQGREFPLNADFFVLSSDLWSSISQKDEFIRRKIADRESYVWDAIIEELCKSTVDGFIEVGSSITAAEQGVRVMARETRFGRRILGKSYKEFMRLAKERQISSRMLSSLSPGVAYIFLHVRQGEDRELREAELAQRCFIARGTVPGCTTVVGISTEDWKKDVECYSYVCYLHKPTWTAEDQLHMEATKQQFNLFKNFVTSRIRENEFPDDNQPLQTNSQYQGGQTTPYISPKRIGPNAPCPCGSGKKYKRCHGLGRQ